MEKRPLLERLALDYFGRLSAGKAVRRDERAHILDAAETAELRSIERGAIWRSALAGALSSVAAGAAELYADASFPAEDGAAVSRLALYWGVVMGVTAIASIIEILYLYWDALRSVHRMAGAAGLPLDDMTSDGVASALARAALELPNPPEMLFGVDPRRESSKWQLLVIALLYKGKIALTTFLLKVIIRRALTRALLRAWILPFVSVPVTAVWNAVVTWWVVREARVRALGPSAIEEVLTELLAGVPDSGAERATMLRGVASTIVRKQSLHPNLRRMLVAVRGAVKHEELEELDSPKLFLAEVAQLPSEAQQLALRLVCVAVVLDGRTSRRDRNLVRDAAEACGLQVTPAQLEALRLAFLRGNGFGREQLLALAAKPGVVELAPSIARAS